MKRAVECPLKPTRQSKSSWWCSQPLIVCSCCKTSAVRPMDCYMRGRLQQPGTVLQHQQPACLLRRPVQWRTKVQQPSALASSRQSAPSSRSGLLVRAHGSAPAAVKDKARPGEKKGEQCSQHDSKGSTAVLHSLHHPCCRVCRGDALCGYEAPHKGPGA